MKQYLRIYNRERSSERRQTPKYKKYMREYHAAHPENNSKQREARALRMVVWADEAKIAEFYKESKRLTLETGVVHEVDHLYPLKGKTVSGLHVHNNLRVCTRRENRKKYNFINNTSTL